MVIYTLIIIFRTNNIKPVFASIRNKVDLDSGFEWVSKFSSKYRLPETTRLANPLFRY
jgi:deoxyinosine 3'endonuclease (endonuclease V)